MTYPTTTKNHMLDGQTFTHVGVHDGFPGTTGANEIASSQVAVSVAASSGGVRSLSATAGCAVSAGKTVRFFGFWNSGVFVGCAPNGGATPKNFMAIASTDTIYCAGHGYADTNKIVFIMGTPPAPLVEGTVYYVRDSATDSFKVAASPGGAAIDITATASSGCWVSAITEDTYASPGTHTLSALTFTIPD